MKQPELYYSKKLGNHVLVGFFNCTKCGNNIEKGVLFKIGWSKGKPPQVGFFCHKHVKESHTIFGNVVDERFCILKTEKPQVDDLRPIIIAPPNLINCNNMSVFEAADTQIGFEEIEDRTSLAGRQSFEGCQIGIDSDSELIKTKDKILTCDDEVKAELEALRKAKPLISKDEVDLLPDESGFVGFEE